MPTVLVVDDDRSMCTLMISSLKRRGYDARACHSGDEAVNAIEHDAVDAVVTDLNMRGMSGIALCERILARRPEVPVIVITAFGSLDTAVSAIRAGAYDFLTKPFEMEALHLALDRALAHRALQVEVRRLREQVRREPSFDEIIGQSPKMRALFEWIERTAPTDASTLITGESGTGKELVAKALHRKSARSKGPFVAINCAALPEALLESELFGHRRGAFTDAHSERTGLFAQAHGGTLFLDEIGDLPVGLQPKLLRALQERRIRPVGSDTEVEIDIRLISATHRDLPKMVEKGTYRDDLYWRIDVVRLELPPLRERGGDILLLAQHFLDEYAARSSKGVHGLSEAAARRFLDYPWPGNVRELQNAIERAVAICQYDTIGLDDLPQRVQSVTASTVPDIGSFRPMDEVERLYVQKVLDSVQGNKREAAKILGFDRKTLYRKLQKWGLDVSDD